MTEVADYDFFISHASEDKEAVARPLAFALRDKGLKVWLDECELTLGDSLRRKIDHGLARAKFGVVILSPAFFAKEWPNKELDGLVAREDGSGKVVLPIWHNVNATEVIRFSPLLAGRMAVTTASGISTVAAALERALVLGSEGPPTAEAVVDSKADSLLKIRREMLTARSVVELRRCQYELEEHLSRYAKSAEARELQVQLDAAVDRAEHLERPAPRYAPSARAPEAYSSSGVRSKFGWILLFIVLALAGYALFRLFGR